MDTIPCHSLIFLQIKRAQIAVFPEAFKNLSIC